jgi:hypothetical protein
MSSQRVHFFPVELWLKLIKTLSYAEVQLCNREWPLSLEVKFHFVSKWPEIENSAQNSPSQGNNIQRSSETLVTAYKTKHQSEDHNRRTTSRPKFLQKRKKKRKDEKERSCNFFTEVCRAVFRNRCAATRFQVCRELLYEIVYSHSLARKRQSLSSVIRICNAHTHTHTQVHHR